MKTTMALRVFAIVTMTAIPAIALASSYEIARAAARSVEQQISAGDWESAQRLLSETLPQCDAGDAGKGCRLLINFNQGYLMQAWAKADPEFRTERLERSMEAYERVLDGAPNHVSTINNLALVLFTLADRERLTQLMSRVLETAPGEAADISLLIGELHRADKEWDAALAAYNDAIRLDPFQEEARRRVVDVLSELPATMHADMLALFRSWEFQYPGIAADGYRTLVRHRRSNDDPTAEAALLRWVAVVSAQRFIGPKMVLRVYRETDFRPVSKLSDILARSSEIVFPLSGPAQPIKNYVEDGSARGEIGWWGKSHLRQHAIAQATLSLGRQSVVGNAPERAQQQWMFGLRYAPPMEWYIYPDKVKHEFPTFDLYTELVWLQFRYPKADPTGEKQNFFVRQLFRQKTEAYHANDLEAIQRLHTVLGEIYFEKQQWTGDWFAANALFQLGHAIDTAEQLDHQEGTYQPLAGLKEKLARAYDMTNSQQLARKTFFDAAAAYLDTDQIDRAEEMLKLAPSEGEDSDAVARRAALGQVIMTRAATAAGLKRSIEPGAAMPLPLIDPTWLTASSIEGLSNDFLLRQQFKAGVDLSQLEAKYGNSFRASMRATGALADAQLLPSLVGTGDVLRLSSAVQLASTAPDEVAPLVNLVSQYEVVAAIGGTALKVNLPSSTTPLYAVLPKTEGVTVPVQDTFLVHFDFDSAEVREQDQSVLRRLAQQLRSGLEGVTVTLTGWTDSKGSRDYNMRLANARASNVADQLIEHGLPRENIRIRAMGEQRQKVLTPDETPEAGNRVVEVVVLGKGSDRR